MGYHAGKGGVQKLREVHMAPLPYAVDVPRTFNACVLRVLYQFCNCYRLVTMLPAVTHVCNCASRSVRKSLAIRGRGKCIVACKFTVAYALHCLTGMVLWLVFFFFFFFFQELKEGADAAKLFQRAA